MPSSGAGGAGENLEFCNAEILEGVKPKRHIRFPDFQFPGAGGRENLALTRHRRRHHRNVGGGICGRGKDALLRPRVAPLPGGSGTGIP